MNRTQWTGSAPGSFIGARGWLVLAALLALSGCVAPLPQLQNAKEMQPNEVILVGRVEMDPPLKLAEGVKLAPDAEGNQILYFLHSSPRPAPDRPGHIQGEEYLNAMLGETFYVRAPAKRWYFALGKVTHVFNSETSDIFFVPAQFYADVKPGDKALYMGTLRYHHNEYFDITKVDLIDDFAKEKKAFEKKFGRSMKLVKRMPKPFKIPEGPQEKQ